MNGQLYVHLLHEGMQSDLWLGYLLGGWSDAGRSVNRMVSLYEERSRVGVHLGRGSIDGASHCLDDRLALTDHLTLHLVQSILLTT